jgi:hypothetical protein
MKRIRLSPSANEQLDAVVQSIIDRLPLIIGTSEVYSGCTVTSMGSGSSLPRHISVRVNDYIQQVLWRGYPAVGVGDEVSVFHFREGNRYEILSVSGSGGYQETGAILRSVWVFDVSETVIIGPYATINAALGYASLTSGDYVLCGCGEYDEEVTLVDGVIITEIVPGTVIINSTATDTAVVAADGGYIQVKEIRCTRSGTDNAYGVDVDGLATGEECTIIAELIRAENQTADTGAEVVGVVSGGSGEGTTYIHANIEAFGNGSNPFAIVAGILIDLDTVRVWGDVSAENTGSSPGNCAGVGAFANDGAIYIHGDVKSTGSDGCVGAAYVGHLEVRGDVIVYTPNASALCAGIYNCNYVSHIGNIYAYGDGSSVSVYGVYCDVGALDGYYLRGEYKAESAHATAVETIGILSASTTSIQISGDAIGTGTGGDRYGVFSDGGDVVMLAGYSYGDTLDLREDTGSLSVFMVEYSTYTGTITSYYPLPDNGWIGLAGGAGARFEFNDSAPDDVVLQDGILTLSNTGLHLLDTDSSHDLIIKPGSDLTADRTLTIITGDSDRSITFANSGTVALGAGTLSVSSINDATLATHTHQITTSSNPGAAASILATDASGYIRVTGFGINASATSTVAFNMYKSLTMAAAAVHTAASYNIRAYGDAAGTSILRGTSFIADLRGSNDIAEGTAFQCDTYNQMDGGTTLTYQLGCISTIRVYSAADTTQATSYRATARLVSTGDITSYWAGFEAYPVTFSSTGAIGNVYGVYIRNLGNALITTNYGIYIDNQSGSGSDYAIYTNTGPVSLGDVLLLRSIKSGATQAAAGAAANEVWKTSSHATLPDNVLMIGV